jgi:hypothetical protein
MLPPKLGSLFLLFAAYASAQEDAALADAAYRYLAEKHDTSRPPLRLSSADLNGDGRMDGVVLLAGNDWCGSGGCKMLVFKGTENGYAFVSASTIVKEPIAVTPETAKGWHTLMVRSGGVGQVLLRFNGKAYPSNPSLQPKATESDVAHAQQLPMAPHK